MSLDYTEIMPGCALITCKNSFYNTRKSKGITFHRFPPDKEIKAKWTAVGSWKDTTPKGRQMKIHNSFKYTQDVNYEARILEFPMQEEHFRVVVLVPNEVDLLHTLYRRLIKEGLAACFASIQPIFTTDSVFRSPDVSVKSETHIGLKEEMYDNFSNESLIQFASVAMDEKGVHAEVLSCLYSTKSKPTMPVEPNSQPEKLPCFFAITFKDSVLFTGQYVA